jgi:hypothetical protein
MDKIITLGIDLAESVFQLHGVDAGGRAVLRRQLRRSQQMRVYSATSDQTPEPEPEFTTT